MESNLLTQEQAHALITEAWEKVEKHKPFYRFGQALSNLLPIDLCNKYVATDKDFFYWKDNDKVLKCFYEYYVEK